MSEQEWLQMFSSNLASLLSENWMTQVDLAEESGISRATISKYINGTQMPKASAIVNLAYALHCDVSDLIDFGEMVEW